MMYTGISAHSYGSNEAAGGYAAVNGIRLYYEIYGQGSPLLLLHGNALSMAFMAAQITAFAQYCRVIAVDTRGHGRSGGGRQPYTYELFAADMAALLAHLDTGPVDVVGWSDGGNTGLVLAMEHPALVKRLVTMGANIFMNDTVAAPAHVAELQRMLQQEQAAPSGTSPHLQWLIRLLLFEPKYSFAALGRITCPVLVMAGENDVISRQHTEGIAAALTNSTLHIAAGQNHHYPVQQPDAFNRVVLRFLGYQQEP